MIEGEEFIAFLSAEALRHHFHAANTNSHRMVYRMNQEWINSVALHKFHNGSPRPIRLDATDFDDVCATAHLRKSH